MCSVECESNNNRTFQFSLKYKFINSTIFETNTSDEAQRSTNNITSTSA